MHRSMAGKRYQAAQHERIDRVTDSQFAAGS